MAQLIKLQDFISRYETDIFRYPSQYIRLKKERWEKVNDNWYKSGELNNPILQKSQSLYEPFEGFDEAWFESEKKSIIGTIKDWFKKKKKIGVDDFDFETALNEQTKWGSDQIPTIEELKLQFLDELFHLQIKWASSTLRDRSFVDERLYADKILKYFLQSYPDNFLLLYRPTLIVKKAPIDLEIILLSPVTTYCISLIESDEMSVYTTDRGHYWFEEARGHIIKRINPIIALKRTESVIQSFYSYYNIDLPVKKVVLSRTGYIEGHYQPANTIFIDKRNYQDWYAKLRNLSSPIKFVQLKAAEALLKHCQSTYVRRYEWEQSEDELDHKSL